MVCKIRKWRPSDAAELAKVLSDKEILDNLRDGLPYPYTEQDGAAFISAMLAADERETFAFAVTVQDKAVGSIGVFRQGNVHRRTAELGYYIAKEYRGKGMMTEAVRQICTYVFDNSDILLPRSRKGGLSIRGNAALQCREERQDSRYENVRAAER